MSTRVSTDYWELNTEYTIQHVAVVTVALFLGPTLFSCSGSWKKK